MMPGRPGRMRLLATHTRVYCSTERTQKSRRDRRGTPAPLCHVGGPDRTAYVRRPFSRDSRVAHAMQCKRCCLPLRFRSDPSGRPARLPARLPAGSPGPGGYWPSRALSRATRQAGPLVLCLLAPSVRRSRRARNDRACACALLAWQAGTSTSTSMRGRVGRPCRARVSTRQGHDMRRAGGRPVAPGTG
jgi:hypothetical protein